MMTPQPLAKGESLVVQSSGATAPLWLSHTSRKPVKGCNEKARVCNKNMAFAKKGSTTYTPAWRRGVAAQFLRA